MCDLITLPRKTVLDARQLIEQQTGIPGGHVMISATHTHTGPALARDSVRDDLDKGSSDPARNYTLELPGADRAGRGGGEWQAGRGEGLLRPGIRGPAVLLPAVLDEGRDRRLESGQAESEYHTAGQSHRPGSRRGVLRDPRQEARADVREFRPARGHHRRHANLGGLSRRAGPATGGLQGTGHDDDLRQRRLRQSQPRQRQLGRSANEPGGGEPTGHDPGGRRSSRPTWTSSPWHRAPL